MDEDSQLGESRSGRLRSTEVAQHPSLSPNVGSCLTLLPVLFANSVQIGSGRLLLGQAQTLTAWTASFATRPYTASKLTMARLRVSCGDQQEKLRDQV